MDYIATAKLMRAKAWQELVSHPAYRAFHAADRMVVELGGDSVMPSVAGMIADVDNSETDQAKKPRIRVRRPDAPPTQPEAAEAVLRELGPMGINDLLDLAKERGANIGGENPLANFRSVLSKDPKFRSIRHNGEYLWWLTDEPLPVGFNEEAADPDSNSESAASLL